MDEEYLTPDEAAAKMRCSKRFVLDEIRRKNLRATKAPGWRIHRDDLGAYMDAHANVSKVRRSA